MKQNEFNKLKNQIINCDDIEMYDDEVLQSISEEEYEDFFNKDELIGYFNEDIGEERLYFKQNTLDAIKIRTMYDKDISNLIDIDKLCGFISKYVDENSLVCMKNICFIYDNEHIEEDCSSVRDNLYEKYSDEYAYYICEEDMLGITWVERQTVIVNVSELIKISIDIAEDPYEYRTAESIFKEGLLQTIFHECRHLLYECNDFIDFQNDFNYPLNGGTEEAVEDYGNSLADQYYDKIDFIKDEFLKDYIFKETTKMEKSYEEYEL